MFKRAWADTKNHLSRLKQRIIQHPAIIVVYVEELSPVRASWVQDPHGAWTRDFKNRDGLNNCQSEEILSMTTLSLCLLLVWWRLHFQNKPAAPTIYHISPPSSHKVAGRRRANQRKIPKITPKNLARQGLKLAVIAFIASWAGICIACTQVRANNKQVSERPAIRKIARCNRKRRCRNINCPSPTVRGNKVIISYERGNDLKDDKVGKKIGQASNPGRGDHRRKKG